MYQNGSLFYPYQLIINPFSNAARIQCYLRPGHLPHQIAKEQQRPPKPRHRSRTTPRHPRSTHSRTSKPPPTTSKTSSKNYNSPTSTQTPRARSAPPNNSSAFKETEEISCFNPQTTMILLFPNVKMTLLPLPPPSSSHRATTDRRGTDSRTSKASRLPRASDRRRSNSRCSGG
jgi:hypothetical protein